jgi:hypothetical protein
MWRLRSLLAMLADLAFTALTQYFACSLPLLHRTLLVLSLPAYKDIDCGGAWSCAEHAKSAPCLLITQQVDFSLNT